MAARGAFEDLEEDLQLAIRVGLAWRELRRGALSAEFRERVYGDLDLGQADALELLVLRGEIRMAELADALRVDASTATRAVRRLVDAGLALRTTATDDARGIVVAATARGRAAHEAVAERRRAAIVKMVSVFDLEERRSLADLMERLVGALDDFVGGEEGP